MITKKNYLLFYSEYLCDYLENVKVLYQIESLVRQKTVYIYMLVFPQSFFRKETLQCVKIHNIYIIYAYVCIYIYIIVIIIIIFMCIPRKPWNILLFGRVKIEFRFFFLLFGCLMANPIPLLKVEPHKNFLTQHI